MGELYYSTKDVMRITGKNYYYACSLVSRINKDLARQGKITFKGQVLKTEFEKAIGVIK